MVSKGGGTLLDTLFEVKCLLKDNETLIFKKQFSAERVDATTRHIAGSVDYNLGISTYRGF